MKQKDLIKEMYRASLANDFKRLEELRQAELDHILEKRKQGKTRFSPKWVLTDRA